MTNDEPQATSRLQLVLVRKEVVTLIPGGIAVYVDGSRSTRAQIMEAADRLRPLFAKMYEDVLDNNGKPITPSAVRAVAVRVAEDIIRERLEKMRQADSTAGPAGEEPAGQAEVARPAD